MAKMKITKPGQPKSSSEAEDGDLEVDEDISQDELKESPESLPLERSARKRKKPARFLDNASDDDADEGASSARGDLHSPKSKRGRVAVKKPVIIVVRNKATVKKESPSATAVGEDSETVTVSADVETGDVCEDNSAQKTPEDPTYPRFCPDCSETYEDKKAWDEHITIWKCGLEPCPYCKTEVEKSSLTQHVQTVHNVDVVDLGVGVAKGAVQREPGVFEPSQPDLGHVTKLKEEKTIDKSIEDREEICPYCASTMSKAELDVHIRTEHEEYVCDVEMDFFDDYPDTEAEDNDQKVIRKRRYSGKWRRELTKCPECSFELTKGSLYRHMRMNHGDVVNKRGRKPIVAYPRQCPDCDEVCEDRRAYDQHRLKHVPRKPPQLVVCEYCGRTYSKASLWKHIETIHPEHAVDSPLKPKASRLPPFPRPCDMCEVVCDDARTWDSHRAKHRPKKPLPPLEQRLLPCPHCAKNMVKSSIDRHIRMVHPEHAPHKPPLIGAKRGPKVRITWPRACPDCKQLFDNKIRYDRHRSDGVCGAIPIQFRKNQVCSYCAQRFRRSEIGRHIKLVHCDQLPPEQRVQYPCRYANCHKVYQKPSSRYSHELTHREEGHNRILQKRKEYRLNKKFLEKTLGFEGIEVQINEGDFRDENGNPTGAFTVTLEEVEDLAASKSIENIGLQTMAAIASHLEPSYGHATEEVEHTADSETRIIQVPDGDARIIQVPEGDTRIIQVPEGDARIIQVPDGDGRIIQVPDGDGRIIQVPEGDARIIEVPEGDARIIQLPDGEFVQYGLQEGEGVQYIQEVEGDLQYAEAEPDAETQVVSVPEADGEVQEAQEEEQDGDEKEMTLSQKPTTLKMMNCRLCNLLFTDSKSLMEHFFKTHTDLMQEVTLTGFELVN